MKTATTVSSQKIRLYRQLKFWLHIISKTLDVLLTTALPYHEAVQEIFVALSATKYNLDTNKEDTNMLENWLSI